MLTSGQTCTGLHYKAGRNTENVEGLKGIPALSAPKADSKQPQLKQQLNNFRLTHQHAISQPHNPYTHHWTDSVTIGEGAESQELKWNLTCI